MEQNLPVFSIFWNCAKSNTHPITCKIHYNISNSFSSPLTFHSPPYCYRHSMDGSIQVSSLTWLLSLTSFLSRVRQKSFVIGYLILLASWKHVITSFFSLQRGTHRFVVLCTHFCLTCSVHRYLCVSDWFSLPYFIIWS